MTQKHFSFKNPLGRNVFTETHHLAIQLQDL